MYFEISVDNPVYFDERKLKSTNELLSYFPRRKCGYGTFLRRMLQLPSDNYMLRKYAVNAYVMSHVTMLRPTTYRWCTEMCNL